MNNPIKFIDPNGKEVWIAWSFESNGKRQTESYQYKNGGLYDKKGNEYKGDNSYLGEVRTQLNNLKGDNAYSKEIVNTLESSDKIHTITNFDSKYDGGRGNYQYKTKKGTQTYFNAFDKSDPESLEKTRNPRVGLIHELTHDFDIDQNNVKSEYSIRVDAKSLPLGEIKAVNVENTVRKVTGDEKKTTWFGVKIPDNRLTDDPKLRDK